MLCDPDPGGRPVEIATLCPRHVETEGGATMTTTLDSFKTYRAEQGSDRWPPAGADHYRRDPVRVAVADKHA